MNELPPHKGRFVVSESVIENLQEETTALFQRTQDSFFLYRESEVN